MFKIALTGPESVGKSTLSKQLAEHFDGIFVSEFARDYVANLNRHYTYEDVEIIAAKQIEQYLDSIRTSNESNSYIFFDTYLIITKIWFKVVYQRYPEWLESAILTYKMDLYLLCYPDLPWIADGIRENEESRMQLYEAYEQELKHYGFMYRVIKGTENERLQNAINIINNLTNGNSQIPLGT